VIAGFLAHVDLGALLAKPTWLLVGLVWPLVRFSRNTKSARLSRRENQGQLEYHLLRSVRLLTAQFGLVIDDLPG